MGSGTKPGGKVRRLYSQFRVVFQGLVTLVLTVALLSGAPGRASAAWSDLWPFGKKEVAEPVPDPVTYAVTFTVEGADRKLEKTLKGASGLIENEKTPTSGLVGLLARARHDVSRLTAVLYENARYAGQVEITLAGRPLDAIGPFDPVGTMPVPVTIRVSAGEPFTFGAIDAAPLPDGMTLDRLGLIAGDPAKASTILAAEAKIADGWRQQGHPLAKIGQRDTIADHRARTLSVRLSIDPGPVANFGRVSVTGTERVDPNLVLRRAGIDGGIYSSKVTRRAETRLRDLGVFESVQVIPADHLDADGTIPVTITVSERKRHVIGASTTYSNTEGLGVEAYWRDRNLFGGAEQLEIRGSVSRLLEGAFNPDYRLAGRFRKPAVLDPMTDFTFRAEGYRETNDSYRVTALESEAGLTHIFSDTLSGSASVEVARSQTVNAGVTEDHLLTTFTGKLEWDSRDNRLDPSSGIHAITSAAPAYDFIQNTAFATFHGDIAAYRAFGPQDRFVLAGRVAASVLAVDDISKVAADRRLYAGGAGSVRGYAYQNLGPRDGSGNNVGGLSAFLVSAEARYRLNDQLGVVAFVDAGNAYASMVPNIGDLRVGVGAGVRYMTPVGPIRFDVAVPLRRRSGDPTVAFYIGLGQAF